MCGIVALLSREKPLVPDVLARATQRLAHRGPDEQCHWVAAHRRVGLGHARLSIIDLSTGTQPIASEDQQLRIVANGEFYDFERIRRDLETRGHVFRTHSDTEIALHLYEEMGARCLDHLRGEFAFVIWDERTQTLFAARDRFGIKPLFYGRAGDTLCLASEVKALFEAGVVPAWDHDSVYRNLFLCMAQDRTLFRGVQQVPPGHYLQSARGSVRVTRYWDVDYLRAGDGPPPPSEAQCIEQSRSLLDESIRLRMRADVPIGFYLSGGVDSSSVLGMARPYSDVQMTAFTVAFDHPDFNEGDCAQETATHCGAEFRRVAVTERDFAANFVEAVYQGEMIHYNAHGTARYLLSRAVQNANFKVVLAGEGADELFAGYGFCRAAVLAPDAGKSWLRSLTLLLRLMRRKTPTERRIAATSPWLARMCRAPGFPADLLNPLAENLALLRSLFRADFANASGRGDPFEEFVLELEPRRTLQGREPFQQLLYLWMKSLFVNYVLAADRLDMAHGVEVRLPFLDHKFFEYARTLPASLLARNGRQKHILREAVRPFVTQRVCDGGKQPFFAPPTTLRVGNPFYMLLQDLLRSQAFSAVPFFDQASVVALLDKLPSMDTPTRTSLDPILFMLASTFLLQKRYGL